MILIVHLLLLIVHAWQVSTLITTSRLPKEANQDKK